MEPPASRYVVLGIRASGATCDVLEAVEDGPLEARRVIMKRLRDPKDPAAIRSFFDECRVVEQLDHPGIVRLLDVGVEGERPFQVLELVEGMDARQIVDACRELSFAVPSDVAFHIVAEVARALDYAHHRPGLSLVHRDVTPENILVALDGRVRLTDFGIAVFSERSTFTAVGMTKGKLAYMSPEQAMASHLDPRADVFSTGCVLHTLLAGYSPLEQQANQDRLLLGEPLVLSEALDGASRAIIEKALAPDRRDRFQEASELAAACQAQVEASEPKVLVADLVDKLSFARASTKIVEGPEQGFTLELERTDPESRSFVGRTRSGATLSEFLTFLGSRDWDTEESGANSILEAPTVLQAPQMRTQIAGTFGGEETTESRTRTEASNTQPNPLWRSSTATQPRRHPTAPRSSRSPPWTVLGGALSAVAGLVLVTTLVIQGTGRDDARMPSEAKRAASPDPTPLIAVPGVRPSEPSGPLEPQDASRSPAADQAPGDRDARRKSRRRRPAKAKAAVPKPASTQDVPLDEVSVNRSLGRLVTELKAAQGKVPAPILTRIESDYLELGTAANRATTPEARAQIVDRAQALSLALRRAMAEAED